MTTQVIFKIDRKIKDQAMKKARGEGIAFASVLKLATKAFISGDLDIALVEKEEFNLKTRREIRQAMKDIAHGKNLSPAFNNANDAIEYLKKAIHHGRSL